MRRDYPRMPAKGTPFKDGTIQTLQNIINFLPKLDVQGDNKTTTVENTPLGNIIRAMPQKAGARKTAQSETPAELDYDGPWSVSIVDAQARTVAVKNGFYSVNGYIVKPVSAVHTLTIPYDDFTYIIYLKVVWNDSLTQLSYEVKVARHDGDDIMGYHDNVGIQLIGDVVVKSARLKSVTNYKNALPQVMIFGAVPI